MAAHRIHWKAPVIAVILGTDALMNKTLEKWVFKPVSGSKHLVIVNSGHSRVTDRKAVINYCVTDAP